MALIRHLPCPRCNSRDNMAEYDNGFYCFGCGYKEPKRNLSRFNALNDAKVCNGITLTKQLSRDALKWLLGYELTDNEMDNFNMCYDNGKNHLILYHSDDYWLARNFGSGVKYLSSGNKPMIVYGDNQRTVVFCEDVISAIKIGRQFTAIPMLGASIPAKWLDNVKNYDNIIIWGDRDMAKRNIIAARKATETLGKQVKVIITEKDPKDYNNNNIYNYIINN